MLIAHCSLLIAHWMSLFEAPMCVSAVYPSGGRKNAIHEASCQGWRLCAFCGATNPRSPKIEKPISAYVELISRLSLAGRSNTTALSKIPEEKPLI